MTSLSLMFGDLELVDNDAGPYKIETLAEGTGWGNPQPIEVAVRSLLQDGSIVYTQGYDNREVGVRVVITAPDSAALAEGEAALFAEIGRRNTLTYTPADGWGPPTAFGVVTSSLSHVGDDLAEVRGQRTYVVRLLCAPFGRSGDEVVVPALPATGTTTTLVDNGSATTNWTAMQDGASVTPVVSSGAVGYVSAALPGTTVTSLTRTASIDTSSTKYLAIDYRPTVGGFVYAHLASDLRAFGDGIELGRVAHVPLTGGLYRATFYVPAASVAALKLDLTVRSSEVGSTTARTFLVDVINRTDIRPAIGTARQLMRTFTVTGSTRTPGRIALEHGTNALGDALVYVWPGQYGTYLPALRSSYRTSGGTVTADATKVSGGREDIENGQILVLDIPQAALPAGRYVILTRAGLQSGTLAATLSWSAQTRVNATNVGSPLTGSASLALTTTYSMFTLGRVSLPVTDVVDRSTATVRFSVTNNSGAATHPNIDDVWLFNMTIGQLVTVPCGTGSAASGGPSKRLFILPATVDTPRPRVLRGHASDLSDAFYASPDSWMDLIFEPGENNVFTVTTNTTDATASLAYTPAWHTHAAS